MKSGVSLCPAVTSMGAPLTPIKYVEGTTTTGSDYCQGRLTMKKYQESMHDCT